MITFRFTSTLHILDSNLLSEEWWASLFSHCSLTSLSALKIPAIFMTQTLRGLNLVMGDDIFRSSGWSTVGLNTMLFSKVNLLLLCNTPKYVLTYLNLPMIKFVLGERVNQSGIMLLVYSKVMLLLQIKGPRRRNILIVSLRAFICNSLSNYLQSNLKCPIIHVQFPLLSLIHRTL